MDATGEVTIEAIDVGPGDAPAPLDDDTYRAVVLQHARTLAMIERRRAAFAAELERIERRRAAWCAQNGKSYDATRGEYLVGRLLAEVQRAEGSTGSVCPVQLERDMRREHEGDESAVATTVVRVTRARWDDDQTECV